jgi:hypothetical protein
MWREEIRRAIASAKIAILLVSVDFLASDFIATDELPPLLEAAEKEGAKILPVILGPCAFEETELAKFQAVNSPAKPLIDLQKAAQEKLWYGLAKSIGHELGVNQSREAKTSQPPSESRETTLAQSRQSSPITTTNLELSANARKLMRAFPYLIDLAEVTAKHLITSIEKLQHTVFDSYGRGFIFEVILVALVKVEDKQKRRLSAPSSAAVDLLAGLDDLDDLSNGASPISGPVLAVGRSGIVSTDSGPIRTDTDGADRLQLTIEALTANPQITDDVLAEYLSVKKPASARYWRLKAMEVLTTASTSTERKPKGKS